MKCSRCGVESEIEQAFTIQRQWAGIVKRTYCPPCWEKVYIREQLFSIAGIIFFVVVLDAFYFGRGVEKVLLDFLFLLLINFPLVIAHELAHTAVGLLLGVRVFRVMIGYGKVLMAGRMFGIAWELRAWPFGAGTLMASPPHSGSRWRLSGAILAGPALHGFLLMAALAFQFLLWILQGWFGVNALTLINWTSLFIFFNLVLLIFNAIPMKAGVPFGQAGTDGLQLLRQAFLKPEEQTLQDQSYYVMEALDASSRNDTDAAQRWIEQGLGKFPEQPALRTYQGVNWMKQKKFSEARGVFLSLLPSEDSKNPYFRNLMLNNIAYADILIRDPELLPEADRYSAEAFRQLRWEPSIIGTRGAVLVEMNRLEEGIGLLKEALKKQKDAFGQAADAYHIAVGEDRRGNAEESRRYFELARKYDPNLFLLNPEPQGVPPHASS
jgi:tetratricopeptide (TPR) repeat protein